MEETKKTSDNQNNVGLIKVTNTILLLSCVILVSLIIGSFILINITKWGSMPYENIVGEVSAYLYKRNSEHFLGSLWIAVGLSQIAFVVIHILLNVLLYCTSRSGRKSGFIVFLTIVLSIAEIQIFGESKVFLVLSIIQIVISIIYPILLKTGRAIKKRSKSQ